MILLPMIAQVRGASGSPPATMQSVIASNVIDLDATLTACYSSGQTWANYCPTPADGSAKADNDFYLGDTSGATATDPTFTGTPGNSAAYWAHDGGDYFTLKSGAGGTTFLRNLHREDVVTEWTALIAMRFVHDAATKNFFGNNSSSSNNNPGFRLGINSSDVLIFQRITGDASASTSNTITTGIDLTTEDGLDVLVAFTFNSDTLAWKASKNGATFASTGTGTALTDVLNDNPGANTISIGAANKANAVPSGTRIYGFYLFNSVLSDADLAAAAALLETRHGRDYTP